MQKWDEKKVLYWIIFEFVYDSVISFLYESGLNIIQYNYNQPSQLYWNIFNL